MLSRKFTLPDSRVASGTKVEFDPLRHLIGSALACGGNPDKDALYLNIALQKNDDRTVYTSTVKDVPVDGFWSISVYNVGALARPTPSEIAATLTIAVD